MSARRTFGFGLLGALLGAVVGALAGFAGGFVWTALAGTSGFEGWAGIVAALWTLAGIVIGLVVGAAKGVKQARR